MSKRSSDGEAPRPKQRQKFDDIDDEYDRQIFASNLAKSRNFATALSTIATSYFNGSTRPLKIFIVQNCKRASADYLPEDKDPDVHVSFVDASYVVNGVAVPKDALLLTNQLTSTLNEKVEKEYKFTLSKEIIVTNNFNFWVIASSGATTFLNDTLQFSEVPLTPKDPFIVSALRIAIEYCLYLESDRLDAAVALYPEGIVLYDKMKPGAELHLMQNIANAILKIKTNTLVTVTLSWVPTLLFYVYDGVFPGYNIAPHKLARLSWNRDVIQPVQGLLKQQGGTCQSNSVVNIILSIPALMHYCYVQIRKLQDKGEWMKTPIASVSDALLRTVYKQSCSGLALDSCPEEMFYMKHILRVAGMDYMALLHTFTSLGLSVNSNQSQIRLTTKKLPLKQKKYVLCACRILFQQLGNSRSHAIAGILNKSEPWIYDSNNKYFKVDWRVDDDAAFVKAMTSRYITSFVFCYRTFIYIHKDFLRKYAAPVVICEPTEADDEKYKLRPRKEVAAPRAPHFLTMDLHTAYQLRDPSRRGHDIETQEELVERGFALMEKIKDIRYQIYKEARLTTLEDAEHEFRREIENVLDEHEALLQDIKRYNRSDVLVRDQRHIDYHPKD